MSYLVLNYELNAISLLKFIKLSRQLFGFFLVCGNTDCSSETWNIWLFWIWSLSLENQRSGQGLTLCGMLLYFRFNNPPKLCILDIYNQDSIINFILGVPSWPSILVLNIYSYMRNQCKQLYSVINMSVVEFVWGLVRRNFTWLK